MVIPGEVRSHFSAYIHTLGWYVHYGKKYFRNLMIAFLTMVVTLAGFAAVASAMAPPSGGAQGGTEGIGGMIQSFLPLILIFVIFYFLLIRPQSKKAKEHKQLLENLKKGDKIMTNGGIYGVIEDIDADTISLKIGIGNDVKIKVNRNYIAGLRTKE